MKVPGGEEDVHDWLRHEQTQLAAKELEKLRDHHHETLMSHCRNSTDPMVRQWYAMWTQASAAYNLLTRGDTDVG